MPGCHLPTKSKRYRMIRANPGQVRRWPMGHRGKETKRLQFKLLLAFTAIFGPLFGQAKASPNNAVYSHDPTRIFWILHLSDTHIGTEYYQEDDRLHWALQEAIPVIQPELVVVTGDLVDGSLYGIPVSGQSEKEWSLYRELLDQAALPNDYYIDLPGNHDLYGDPGFRFYLDWSLSGQTTRTRYLQFPFGNFLVYGCSTPDEAGDILIEHPEFSEAELDELESVLNLHHDADLIFVFGHHGPHQPQGSDVARWIMQQHQAMYFHGHSHVYETYLMDDLLTHQVDSLGKATRENVALIAVDNNWVAYAVTDSADPWPFIVISAPANSRLSSNEQHPYAYSVCNTAPANPVRALVFDLQALSKVTFQAGDEPEVEMHQDPQNPMLWSGEWDTRDLSEGELTLWVHAWGTRQRSQQIQVRIADVECPTEPEPPDAGPDPDGQDGSDTDCHQGDCQIDGGDQAGADTRVPDGYDTDDGDDWRDAGTVGDTSSTLPDEDLSPR